MPHDSHDDDRDPDDWSPAEHARYQPPWRDRLATGELSPPYGPRSAAAYDAARRHHAESVHAGGLWDHAETPSGPRAAAAAVRADSDEVLGALRQHPGLVSPTLREVAWAYWGGGETVGRIAARLSRPKTTVRHWVYEIRLAVRELRGRH